MTCPDMVAFWHWMDAQITISREIAEAIKHDFDTRDERNRWDGHACIEIPCEPGSYVIAMGKYDKGGTDDR